MVVVVVVVPVVVPGATVVVVVDSTLGPAGAEPFPQPAMSINRARPVMTRPPMAARVLRLDKAMRFPSTTGFGNIRLSDGQDHTAV
ncbi:hypothetical protein GCM10012275_57090 [Longimycelium tulufanense]|uniref:Uncharacterized protein n=1 Tax=Longimycelium tulufanense TaxID=907463 RepID=A0A8J3CKT7_9PSEU|nr:hypothetical protein GCM10012275_57090 [Longimycelium tulufanense]